MLIFAGSELTGWLVVDAPGSIMTALDTLELGSLGSEDCRPRSLFVFRRQSSRAKRPKMTKTATPRGILEKFP